MQVAPVPTKKSASDTSACAPGTEEAGPGPGSWFFIPGDDSPAVDRDAAALSSGSALGDQEAGGTPSPRDAAGVSHPPFIRRVGLDGVASMQEVKVYVEPPQFYCSTSIMVPGGKDSKPYTVLDSRVETTCVSELTVCALQKQFKGVDVICLYDVEQHQVVLLKGWTVPIQLQTCILKATIMTPWAPVAIRLALAVMLEENDSVGSKTPYEKLLMGAMKQLRGTTAASGGGVGSTEPAPANVPAIPSEVFRVRRVGIAVEAV